MKRPPEELWRSWVERRDGRAFADLVGPELPHVVGAVTRSGVAVAEAEDALPDALVERPGRASSLSCVTGTPGEMASLPALASILRATDLPAAKDVRSVALSRGGEGFFWEACGPWPATWRIDATTGRLLESQ